MSKQKELIVKNLLFKFFISLLTFTVFFSSSRPARAVDPNLFLDKEYSSSAYSHKMPYRLFVPKNYNSLTKYPLVLFLHGAGGRGNDNVSHLYDVDIGLVKLISSSNQAANPSFIIAPQCPNDEQWVDTPWGNGSYDQDNISVSDEMLMVKDILDLTISQYNIDTSRLYLTGLSMGGYGAWDMVTRFSNFFAAVVPICGAGSPNHANLIKDLPIWAFHGSSDGVVPVSGSREMIASIEALGGNPKYTEYPGTYHNSWNKAYIEPELLPWIYAQTKGSQPQLPTPSSTPIPTAPPPSPTPPADVLGEVIYYVDKACPFNGSGISQTCASTGNASGAFNSLANAQASVTGNQSDNHLLLKKGQTFSGTFTVGAFGTAGHPFTISSYGTGSKPTISGGSSTIVVSSGSYIVIDGLHITKATGAWQAGINISQSASNITIQNCLVDYCDYGGIKSLDASHIIIDSNTLAYCGQVDAYAIDVRRTSANYNPTGIVIKNNIVHHTIDYGIMVIGEGISSRIQGVEIYNNDSYENSTGLYLHEVDNSLIYNNKFHHNSGPSEEYGIAVGACSNNKFYNNEIYDNNNMGIQFYGDASWGPSNNNLFYQNIISNSHLASIGVNGFGLNISSVGSGQYASGNQVYYNIIKGNKRGIVIDVDTTQSEGTIYNNTIYGHSSYGVWLETSNPGYSFKNNLFAQNDSYDIYGQSTNSLTHANNAYYSSPGGNRVMFNNTNFTLADLKSAFEPSAIVTDPKLTSATNFHLLADSPCINAGVDVGLTSDYQGNLIVGLPDVGAYEYSGVAPPTATIEPIVHCLPLGDIDCSGKVNSIDFSYLIAHLDTSDPQSDLDDSGSVNYLDLSPLFDNYGMI
ncbi:right-handed parallel beta-helix repeat-containing protein [Patescibacteria group bacterium]